MAESTAESTKSDKCVIAREMIPHFRGPLFVLICALPFTACKGKATPAQAEEACRRDLELHFLRGWERTLRERGDTDEQIEASHGAADNQVIKLLKSKESLEDIAECKDHFLDLSTEQADCLIAAKTVSEFEACPPKGRRRK